MSQKSWSYAILFLRYAVWWMQLLFFILGYCLLFYFPPPPVTAWTMKISKQWKKRLEISSFHTSVPKIMIICHTVPEIWCVRDVIAVFHFGLLFVFLPSSQPEKWKFQNNEKNTRRYHHFTQVYQKSWPYAKLFLRHSAWRM